MSDTGVEALSQTSKSASMATEILQLHPEGNAVLTICDPTSETPSRFLVSSQVLSAASVYISALFKPCFKEGLQTRQGEYPTIPLEDDDPGAMKTILSLLHYHNVEDYDVLDPESLATVAIQSDKYDCTKALRPWVSQWFGNSKEVSKPEELGFLLVAAYFFDTPMHFKDISTRAVRDVNPDLASMWRDPKMNLLPEGIKGTVYVRGRHCSEDTDKSLDALDNQLSRPRDDFYQRLQSVEESLQMQSRGHIMPGPMCMGCGRWHPPGAKKCHPCKNSILHQRHCTSQYRVAEYFAIMRRNELWPSLEPFKTCAISDLAFRFACAAGDTRHQCNAGLGCPLKVELRALSKKVGRVIAGMEGVRMDLGGATGTED